MSKQEITTVKRQLDDYKPQRAGLPVYVYLMIGTMGVIILIAGVLLR